jgi:hypothetical protein
MGKNSHRIVAIDCETDPFLYDRIPKPFIWGSYDGERFETFDNVPALLHRWRHENCYLYAHNGGKFDFMFMLSYLEETRAQIIGSRLVEMRLGRAVLRDSFALMPEALASYAKTTIDYWKLEQAHRHEWMDEIRRYLFDDCRYLRDLVCGFFHACHAVGDGKNRRYGSTVAGNALTVSRKMGLDPGRTSHRFDAVFRPFYFGGRTECRVSAGVYSAINVYDIKSAYPYAMSHDMPTGSEYTVSDSIDGLSTEQVQRAFIDCTCFSDGAFPLLDGAGLSFRPVLARFMVTGWEYVAATRHDMARNCRVNRVIRFPQTINFTDYVKYWFDEKQAADARGDKLQRLIAKRMMNSLYGKFAQNPVHYRDYRIVDGGTPVDHKNGWQLDCEFEGKELHARPTLWRIRARNPDDWESFPIHYNVATAASITGFCRAMVLDAIAAVGSANVVYCDTDSIFCRNVPAAVQLRQDGGLGAWEWEGYAEIVALAGKKLYALRYTNGPNTGKEKLATKGAKLTYEEIVRVARGETVVWRNQAPTFSIGSATKFVVRNIRATAPLRSNP